jgi:hypothetical protein
MSRSDFVTLRGGLTLPLGAVQLALDLEQRGLHLRREDGDVLFVGPRERLTDDDRAGLRRWKRHLLAILEYDADAHEAPQ